MSLKHKGFHRYELKNIGTRKEYKVYHCNLPGCTHYKPQNMMSNVMSLCNRCDEPFLWDKEKNRRSVKPHCDKCTKNVKHEGQFKSKKPKPEVDRNAVQSILGSILLNANKHSD